MSLSAHCKVNQLHLLKFSISKIEDGGLTIIKAKGGFSTQSLIRGCDLYPSIYGITSDKNVSHKAINNV